MSLDNLTISRIDYVRIYQMIFQCIIKIAKYSRFWPFFDLLRILWASFLAFYRLFCKIANHRDIELKFSGFIFDVNMENPAKFREVSMPIIAVAFPKIGISADRPDQLS